MGVTFTLADRPRGDTLDYAISIYPARAAKASEATWRAHFQTRGWLDLSYGEAEVAATALQFAGGPVSALSMEPGGRWSPDECAAVARALRGHADRGVAHLGAFCEAATQRGGVVIE